MLVLILAAEIVLAIFLLGVLLIAVTIAARHRDTGASYRLYAVRDGLIDACVFENIPRSNPWLEALYTNVNNVLRHSNLVGGPKGWSLATVSDDREDTANLTQKLIPLPDSGEECPTPILALQPELRRALEQLAAHHFGLCLRVDARDRQQKRVQQEKARHLLEMIKERDDCSSFA